ncbi:MAG: Aspartate--tRNA(Asp/Asn) ligase [Pseudomonadota bacterium]
MEWRRSNLCGTLRVENLGETVTLMGWCQTRRDHGGVIFVDLRDYTGICQVVFRKEASSEAHERADSIRSEFVIAVRGKVENRIEGNVNPKLPTGEIEIVVHELNILSESQTPPYVMDEREQVEERLRLQYRYLDLRHPTMQKNLILRSKAMQQTRNFLADQGFFEIETPMLTKSTPEGARDYLVPSRVHPGSFYALPQSPQIFKQLLMVSGYDRYMQIARCFRDEDLRGNRQPEFTQLDLEMSFIQPEDIYNLVEGLLSSLFETLLDVKISTPFERMPYQTAMEDYGVDAPDLRFDLKLKDISDIAGQCGLKVFSDAIERGGIAKAINVKGGSDFSRKELDELTEFVKIYGAKGMAWVKRNEEGWQSPIAKFFSAEDQRAIEERLDVEVGDLILFGADNKNIVNDALGNLRKEVARRRKLIPENTYKFVWITDFPLLEYSASDKRFHAVHHPFTMPNLEDFKKYGETEPQNIRSVAYDVVLNGVELGGGSIRIHRQDIQQQVFKWLELNDSEIEEKFGFLLQALSYGAPPHGGIALGFDRLMMFLLNTDSIRDVVAFPKTQRASCLMTEAPSEVPPSALEELNLRVRQIPKFE